MTKAFAKVYLAAMIDGEGCVSISYNTKGGRKASNRQVSIANSDLDIIETCAICLDVLDIPWWSHERPVKPNGTILIQLFVTQRRGFDLIEKLVPIQSARKLAKLAEIQASYAPGYKYFETRRVA